MSALRSDYSPQPEPAFDAHHCCDRCECSPSSLTDRPLDERIFLIQFNRHYCDGNIASYMYMCSDCMVGYTHTFRVVEGPDDDEDDVEEDPSSPDEDPQ